MGLNDHLQERNNRDNKKNETKKERKKIQNTHIAKNGNKWATEMNKEKKKRKQNQENEIIRRCTYLRR